MTNEEEVENEKLKKNLFKLDQDMNDEFEKSKQQLFDKIASLLNKNQKIESKEIKPIIIKMPKIFDMSLEKFMICEMKEFSDLAEKSGYRKVTSSLNYLITFSAKEMPDVKSRIEEIRSYLRNWKVVAGKSLIQKEETHLVEAPCEQPKNENTAKSLEDHQPISEDE